MSATRLPQDHDPLADEHAYGPLSEDEFFSALDCLLRGVAPAGPQGNPWDSLRKLSPGALAASVACG